MMVSILQAVSGLPLEKCNSLVEACVFLAVLFCALSVFAIAAFVALRVIEEHA